MYMYRKQQVDNLKKLTEIYKMAEKFSTRWKMNVQRIILLFYSTSKPSDKEIKWERTVQDMKCRVHRGVFGQFLRKLKTLNWHYSDYIKKYILSKI